MFVSIQALEMQVVVMALASIWLGFLVQNYWFHIESHVQMTKIQAPESFVAPVREWGADVAYNLIIIVIGLLAIFPSDFDWRIWLPSALALGFLGFLLGFLNQYLMLRLPVLEGWLGRRLMLAMSLVALVALSVLSLIFGFHLLKLVPTLLIFLFAWRAYGVPRGNFLKLDKMGHWWLGMMMNIIAHSLVFLPIFWF